LEDIIGYLESCGARRDWIGYVVSRCPQLLNMSMDELETRVRFYTDMGMDEKDFGTMVYDYPGALGFLSLEEMNSKVFALCLVLLLCLFRRRLNTGRIISPFFMLFIFCSLI
jgi:mTERF domain-containing protein